MNRFISLHAFAFVLMVLGLPALAVHALAAPNAAAQESFLVDGTFSVTDSHGSDLTVFLEGVLYLDDDTPLHFTINANVKHSGNRIEGTPTMVFDDGSTLSLSYEVKFDHDTGIYEGDFLITGGTGQFAGASGVGEICYPLAHAGPLMMDGTLSR